MKRAKHADIIDVANHAGVSPATVSRVFNHPSKVKPETRKRIQSAVDELGYIRNRAAQAIHGRKSGTIGLIVPTLDNAIFSNLIQSFSESLDENGLTMLVTTHGYDLDKEYALLRSLFEHRVDGLGLIGLDHRTETYTLLERRGIPSVAMWNYSSDSRVSCVGSDNKRAGELITEHVLSLGHRKIGLVFPNTQDNDRAIDRLSGVVDCLNAANILTPEAWSKNTKYSVADARACGVELLQNPDRPSAIICGNDVIAQGVISAALSLGLNVPNDVSVAGIGDFSGSKDYFPSITTVRLRSNEIGRKAALVLIDGLNVGGETKTIERISVDAELHDRESTAPPRS